MTPGALYVIDVWTLLGMGFGFMATSYGACRKTYRMPSGIGHFLDWFWWVLAAAAFLVAAFWTEWGIFRVWSVAFILIGYLLWSWLAAPLMLALLFFVTRGQARVVHFLLWPLVQGATIAVRRFPLSRKPPKKE